MVDPLIKVRLAVLTFAAAQWFVAWLMRYLPLHIKNSVLRLIVQVAFPGAMFGVWMAQGALYRSLTGIQVLKKDQFFTVMTLIEYLISTGVILLVAFERRKKSSHKGE